ncbi:GntR family transcriptional regulator [Gluconacetobacter tumulisoli]|uniref:GntR family transcriptional regulator n=1 Tax=Gluconacetobacter tumulisoli TaxID=1286189 RepID=A0A7W4PMD3_9PROT|nr:GntR family transcriptional regulator [Gluconacetobacter tumulisoli]MBB2203050.1 GntR family transcriptional regulator [Gluconacetobacter tumulisoli]
MEGAYARHRIPSVKGRILSKLALNQGTRAGSRREPSLTDQAYALLRREIITCQLPPDSDVSELDLAERLGMSKTPVREALARLAMEGLLDIYPRRGYRIRPVTIKDINDLFAVRTVLERTAASFAAQNMTTEDLDRLERLASASYDVAEESSIDYFINANRDFHVAIAKGSQNPRLSALVISHLEESERFFYIGARKRDVNMETNQEHAEIVTVLRSRDHVAAGQIMAKHTESTRAGLTTSLLSAHNSTVPL